MAQQLQRLVSFYQFVHQEHEIPPTYNTVVADDLNSPQVLVHGVDIAVILLILEIACDSGVEPPSSCWFIITQKK
jgi:hypothetical protein